MKTRTRNAPTPRAGAYTMQPTFQQVTHTHIPRTQEKQIHTMTQTTANTRRANTEYACEWFVPVLLFLTHDAVCSLSWSCCPFERDTVRDLLWSCCVLHYAVCSLLWSCWFLTRGSLFSEVMLYFSTKWFVVCCGHKVLLHVRLQRHSPIHTNSHTQPNKREFSCLR